MLGLVGCVLNMAVTYASAWHRLLRPIYFSVRWPDMTLIGATLLLSLRDVLPHIVLLIILNAAAALVAMVVFPSDPAFSTYATALENTLVFTSGSNAPDVMLPSLRHTSTSAVFFVAVCVLSTVLILGIVLATLYNRSMSYLSSMSHKRLVLRRAAFRLAFVCLDRISQTVANGRIDKATMAKLLRRVWHVDDRMIGLLIALLDKDNCGTINVHEFTYLFELMLLKVQRVGEKATWFQRHCHGLYRACKAGVLASISDLLLVANMVVLAVDLSASAPERSGVCAPYCVFYLLCALAYMTENVLTATVIGWRHTLRSPIGMLLYIHSLTRMRTRSFMRARLYAFSPSLTPPPIRSSRAV